MLSFLELMERVEAFRNDLMRQGFDVLLNIDVNYDSSVKVDIVIETVPVVEEAADQPGAPEDGFGNPYRAEDDPEQLIPPADLDKLPF